ncbi:MAG TPA: 4-carboxymuconolactone decarboxylase [Actinobacteria bacterium]|nr:4-carboxymuconolactone decarboxylase [Actinomycetota bacterium]
MPAQDLCLDEDGLRLRRAVIGDDWVDSSLDAADEFTRPLQEIATNNVWGNIWTRPGLSLTSRSLVTVAILVALNRPAELALHVAGALRNGCSRDEIREVLIHCSAYCGMPAAVDAFAVARKVLADADAVAAGGRSDG